MNQPGKIPSQAVTSTVNYTTGTALVLGNRCTNWVWEEFRALIDTIRTVYTLVASRHTQSNLHKEVDEGLRFLPLTFTGH